MDLHFKWCLLHFVSFVALISALRYPSQNLDTNQRGISDEKFQAESGAHRIEKRQAKNESVYFQSCQAPNKKPGHCTHLEDCLIPEFTEKYAQNTKYFCVIDQKNALYAGVCCPDDRIPVQRPIRATSNSSPTSSNAVKSAETEQARICGINGKKQSNMDAGEQMKFYDWPWMVALMSYKSYKKTLVHFCGGVLISNRHVISAAHCFNKMKWQETTVRIGAYDFKKVNEHPYTDYRVSAGKIHNDYDDATYENDIIIMRLDRPVEFKGMTRPICLPQSNFDVGSIVNRTAVVAGWGSTGFGEPPSNVLLQVSVPIWDHETCKDQYTQPVAETTVCAAGYEGGKDACQGDSGGPLFFQRPDGRWTNIGVVSWGVGCAAKGRPGIYTRVTDFLTWIAKAQKQM